CSGANLRPRWRRFWSIRAFISTWASNPTGKTPRLPCCRRPGPVRRRQGPHPRLFACDEILVGCQEQVADHGGMARRGVCGGAVVRLEQQLEPRLARSKVACTRRVRGPRQQQDKGQDHMKLATLRNGRRDGKLVVVSRDLRRCTDASFL